jgi:hypothetical protein
MKTRFLLLGLAALCLSTAPAMADMFSFTYDGLQTWYSPGSQTFTADVVDGISPGSVTRIEPVGGSALFGATGWEAGPKHFLLSMVISNIGGGGTTADGSGSFTLTDIDSDTISADIHGQWEPQNTTLRFHGDLSNVVYTPSSAGETTFDGNLDSVSMVFSAPSPWVGTLIELTASGLTFTSGWGDGSPGDGVGGIQGGGVTATITAVPVPAALLLGFLGLGTVGLKLRRLA